MLGLWQQEWKRKDFVKHYWRRQDQLWQLYADGKWSKHLGSKLWRKRIYWAMEEGADLGQQMDLVWYIWLWRVSRTLRGDSEQTVKIRFCKSKDLAIDHTYVPVHVHYTKPGCPLLSPESDQTTCSSPTETVFSHLYLLTNFPTEPNTLLHSWLIPCHLSECSGIIFPNLTHFPPGGRYLHLTSLCFST